MLLEAQTEILLLQLVFCPILQVRNSIIELLLHVLKCLLVYEEPMVKDLKIDDEHWKKTTAFSFIDKLINIIIKNTQYKQFPQLFKIIHQIAKIGPVERQFLLNRETIRKFVDLYVNITLQESSASNFKKMVSFIFTLVSGCGMKHNSKQFPPTQMEGIKLVLPQSDYDKLLSGLFLDRVIKQNINYRKICRIMVHFVWENESMSENVIKLLIELITSKTEKNNLEKISYLFDVVNHILELDDSIKKKRVKMFIIPFLDILATKKDIQERALECVEWIRHLQRLNKPDTQIREWLRKNESKWDWIPKWYTKSKEDSFLK